MVKTVDIGEQIKELREKKNIEIPDLAIGICTDKLEFILSEEIYDEEEQKAFFEECLERGDGERADKVLEQWFKSAPEDSNVHKMFYCRNKAYAELRVGKNPKEARSERIAQGYSREQMITGVYKNPESLSRAEWGKATMRDSKLIRLFHRLGIDKTRYNGFVVTDKYEVLELKQKVDIFISKILTFFCFIY